MDETQYSSSSRKEIPIGALAHDVRDAIYSIITRAYADSVNVVSTKCEIPDGYVRLETEREPKTPTYSSQPDVAKLLQDSIPSALFSSILVTLGLAIDAPALALISLSGGGAVIGSLLQKKNSYARKSEDFQLQELQVSELHEEDVSIKLTIDPEKLNACLKEANREIEELCSSISRFEYDSNQKPDVSIDRNFGEWVQKFLVYVDSKPDDRKLQLLRDLLIDRLASLNINVYDEVIINDDGKPDVPFPDYLLDSRAEGQEQYEKVLRPAVFSSRSLLARGEII